MLFYVVTYSWALIITLLITYVISGSVDGDPWISRQPISLSDILNISRWRTNYWCFRIGETQKESAIVQQSFERKWRSPLLSGDGEQDSSTVVSGEGACAVARHFSGGQTGDMPKETNLRGHRRHIGVERVKGADSWSLPAGRTALRASWKAWETSCGRTSPPTEGKPWTRLSG